MTETISPTLIIRKVQNKEPLSKAEVSTFLHNFKDGKVPDYQMSAFLMAVYYQGLSKEEKQYVTEALLTSGEQVEWSEDFNFVDKHSTGGTGDKTSMVLAPLLAALGYKIPMMAGRGLGHTGGTLDKLESLEGVTTNLSISDLKKNVLSHGFSYIGQTDSLCPADRKLYALRDVTCTVSSLPLITASIVSKKIAEGVKSLVYDVKTGSGAFIKNFEDSIELANSLVETSEGLGAKSIALVSDMSQPLGRYVGNTLEMIECFEILNDSDGAFEKYQDTVELTLHLCASLMSLHEDADYKSLYQKAFDMLKSKKPLELSDNLLKSQGWSGKQPSLHEKFEDYFISETGYISEIDNESIGWASVELGGGRKNLEDKIDPAVGFYFYKKIGDSTNPKEPVLRIYFNDDQKLETSKKLLNKAFKVSNEKVTPPELVKKTIKGRMA